MIKGSETKHLYLRIGTQKNQSTLYPTWFSRLFACILPNKNSVVIYYQPKQCIFTRWFSQFIVWRLPNHLTCKLCNFKGMMKYDTHPNFMHFKGLWSLKITRQVWFPSKNGSHFMIPEIVSNMFFGEILAVSGNLNFSGFSSPKKFPSKTTPRGHWSHRGPWKFRFLKSDFWDSEIFWATNSGWKFHVLLRLILPEKL